MTGTATTTPQVKNLIGRASENKRAARAPRTYEQVRAMKKFHVVIWQTASKNTTKVRAARAARLFFLIQPIRSLFSDFVVAVAVSAP